jgi:mono/diheme cytochrome c family protein
LASNNHSRPNRRRRLSGSRLPFFVSIAAAWCCWFAADGFSANQPNRMQQPPSAEAARGGDGIASDADFGSSSSSQSGSRVSVEVGVASHSPNDEIQSSRDNPAEAEVGNDENDDADLQLGLLRRLTVAGTTVEAITAQVSWSQRNGFRADPSLPLGPASVVWSGQIVVQAEGDYQFHAWTSGPTRVVVGEQVVLSPSALPTGASPRWHSGPVTRLNFGEWPILVEFTNQAGLSSEASSASSTESATLTASANDPARRTAADHQLQLFWSSDSFALEPVPSHLLFHQPRDAIDAAAAGRDWFDALRCQACHGPESPDARWGGPDLSTVGVGTDRRWLLQKLQSPHRRHTTDRMPGFGFSAEEAEAILVALESDENERRAAAEAWLRRPIPSAPSDASRDQKSAENTPPERAAAKPAADVAHLDENAVTQGGRAIQSMGCLGCHQWQGMGSTSVWGGGPLDGVGQYRSGARLAAYLQSPETFHAGHRMPAFDWKPEGLSQVVAALVAGPRQTTESAGAERHSAGSVERAIERLPPDSMMVQRGRELIHQARCAACHRLPDAFGINQQNKPTSSRDAPAEPSTSPETVPAVEPRLPHSQRLPPLSAPSLRLQGGCLSEAADRATHRPSFGRAPKESLLAYLDSIDAASRRSDPKPAGSSSPAEPRSSAESPRTGEALTDHGGATTELATTELNGPRLDLFVLGERLLIERGCLGCHDRQGSRGLSNWAKTLVEQNPDWQGQSPTLVPPSLTAVGDRLTSSRLSDAIAGRHARRLPWLRVQMPRFDLSPLEAQAIQAVLVDTDYVPAEAPATPPSSSALVADEPQVQLAGRELLGPQGFNCLACHALKDYQPPQVALGTKGSNLADLGARVRAEYFFRWMRGPQRILPGTEMPAFQRPHPTLLKGNLGDQVAAVWLALNRADLIPPATSVAAEQFLSRTNDPVPRVVRDVFREVLSDAGRSSIPRSLAAGFANGHAVLFDIDRAAVRCWTLGDFARQRTQGKSWFWELAGTPLAEGMGSVPDAFLLFSDSQQPIAPETGWNPEVQLLSYESADQRVSLRYRLTYRHASQSESKTVLLREDWRPAGLSLGETVAGNRPLPSRKAATSDEAVADGWDRTVTQESADPGCVVWLRRPVALKKFGNPQFLPDVWIPAWVDGPLARRLDGFGTPRQLLVRYRSSLSSSATILPVATPSTSPADRVTVLPGFRGTRLALPNSIMPTAIAWNQQGDMAFTSLRGDVWLLPASQLSAVLSDRVTVNSVVNSAADSVDDPATRLITESGAAAGADPSVSPPSPAAIGPLVPLATGLAAPYGILADGDDWLVCHKPEVLRFAGRSATVSPTAVSVFASGWGYTDDYHDWTCGLVRDPHGNLYWGLGSDYTHKQRPPEQSRYRGHVLQLDREGHITSVASGLRYPTGLTFWQGQRLIVSDQQGVQNRFNELNAIVSGRQYGVPGRHDPPQTDSATEPAVNIPHPWTRSVNGLATWPSQPPHPFSGQVIGAEYNGRFLIRASFEEVDGELQGAVYPFSLPGKTNTAEELLGPLSVGFSPDGALYVGSIHDSGWLGGRNTGDLVQFVAEGSLPNGIQEVRVHSAGFDLEFLHAIDPVQASQPDAYRVLGYTRVWQGDYATPDSQQHSVTVESATVQADGRTVRLQLATLRPGHVYDLSIAQDIGTPEHPVTWPRIAHYTLHRLPANSTGDHTSNPPRP